MLHEVHTYMYVLWKRSKHTVLCKNFANIRELIATICECVTNVRNALLYELNNFCALALGLLTLTSRIIYQLKTSFTYFRLLNTVMSYSRSVMNYT